MQCGSSLSSIVGSIYFDKAGVLEPAADQVGPVFIFVSIFVATSVSPSNVFSSVGSLE